MMPIRRLLLPLLLLAGCAAPSETPADPTIPAGPEIASPTATPPATNGSNASIEGLLRPNRDDLPFPVYEDFAEVADLFTQRDGRTYVINFWATWCQPCIAELPYFEQLAREAGPDVEVIMVSLDFQRDLRTKLQAFVAGRPDLPPVVALADADYNSWIDRVNPDWGGAIPVTVIYRDDRRAFHAEQYDSYAELRAAVTALR